MGITLYDRRLAGFLFGKTRRGLLGLFYGHPEESFYVNQILQSLKAGSGAVQRELKLMTEAGIITREIRGNLVYYRANQQSPVFAELRGLVRKTTESAAPTRDSLVRQRFKIAPAKLAQFCRRHHINKLSLFGSVLREDFRPESDIDVLVEFAAGHVPGFAIVDIEKELGALLGRTVDMRTPADLSRYIRDQVVREARVEYEHA